MEDRKAQERRMKWLRRRHVERAISASNRQKKGIEPDTVLHSARIIGIDPNKKCPAERQLQQGHKEK